jgi:ribosomal protein L12E/L44/L45/RPP1/RPP2
LELCGQHLHTVIHFRRAKLKRSKRPYIGRIGLVLLMAGVIGSQIPSTSNVAFAQGIYVDPDDYIKKSDMEAAQLKQTVITLAGVGVISYLTTVIKAATTVAAAPAAATAAGAAPAASPGNSGTPVSAEASTSEAATTAASGGQ